MIRKDLLKTIIVDNQSRVLPELWKRTLIVPVDSGKIITLAGVRRSGKTYHLYALINQLKKQGISPEKILYINFEDERLDLTIEEFDGLLQAYQELYPKLDFSECYFFFDEIQEVEGWEKFIARLYAQVSKQIFITGSNAKLLSKEIATALRGRTLTFEVYPLSFVEFVNIISFDVDYRTSVGRAKMVSLFDQFMHQGGFPELIGQHEDLKESLCVDGITSPVQFL